MAVILIAEDEKNMQNIIIEYMKRGSHSCIVADDGIDAVTILKNNPVDLAILDIMLPDINGFELCQKIRQNYHYPVIMLTAKSEEIDKITGLTLGADDYITKPFLPLELVARVKAQLRRYKRYNQDTNQENDILVHSGLVLNMKSHECTLNEKPLSLTPIEFSILRILCEQKGTVVSSEELFHQIWGDEYFNKNNNTITVHIRHLREKMGDSFEEPKYIKTVWGCGYKIEN